jgi:peptide/nickel transport system permease protein
MIPVNRTDDETTDEGVEQPRPLADGSGRSTGEPAADGGSVSESNIPLDSVSVEETTLVDRIRKYLAGRWETFQLAWEDWRFKAGFLVILGYVLVGTVGVRVVDQPSFSDGTPFETPGQSETLLGTDHFGQDILGLIVHATPDMLLMLLGGAVFATGVGAAIGILAGYKGGRADAVLMTMTDTAMMIPALPLIIIVGAIWEPTDPIVVGILVSINAWAGAARTLRSQVLTIRDAGYVEASRVMNVSTSSILRKDITPQLLPLILVNFVISGRGVIFNAVALYFLGVLPVEQANWGVMLQSAFEAGAVTSPRLFYMVLWPMLTIVLISWGLIMLSQGLDRVVNARVRDRDARAK